ncbi:MAG: hypothetical protein BJ554DRAFT_6565 [Olpidium bornovanus]|uniref:CRIB domain-containing protein n=1 Tax=Olpidium bornovanus TaxID=278681 RepID=A0A8H7ZXP2_9FUNG|nr:MAG: hypothetical protein BJ554DRAFT_6565 [Olpidium bornovanus]
MIGQPLNFQHLSHVGWSSEKGFDVRGISFAGGEYAGGLAEASGRLWYLYGTDERPENGRIRIQFRRIARRAQCP